MWLLWLLCLRVSAYNEATYRVEGPVSQIHVRDACTLYATTTTTTLQFHNSAHSLSIPRSSPIVAMNQQCDLVAFGYPLANKVVLWRPFDNTIIYISPPRKDATRFGFALDVQDQTWVVGAPGEANDQHGKGATVGYAFVFHQNSLQSCRSVYESTCYHIGTECQASFQVWKNVNGLTHRNGAAAAAFQKNCTLPTLPTYFSPEFLASQLPLLPQRQFGYSVALVGSLAGNGSTLYISAPGDTQRFMEQPIGNYGQVFVWDLTRHSIKATTTGVATTIYWWQMQQPMKLPGSSANVYRAFGRKIAASRFQLVVSTYPRYEQPSSPFILVYRCHQDAACKPGLCDSPRLATKSYCKYNSGITVNSMDAQALLYYSQSPDMKNYATVRLHQPYISTTLDKNLGDFQNDLIGQDIGVAGSNVIVPDPHNGHVYRMGPDSKLREKYRYSGAVGYGTDSEHWSYTAATSDEGLTMYDLEPCKRGETGGRSYCAPVPIDYYSNDGWLKYPDLCPNNYTTSKAGHTKCKTWVPPPLEGLSWADTFFIMEMIGMITVILFVRMVLCQYLCVECLCAGRRPRKFRKLVV